MAATARSTPNFTLPATQNTAPVYEFRCLYTHDVRKKAKKWHDGSARFHTFNRRVMVYDDTKNYIGDLHYRADEEFGDGVELQLDRGVLVEIGERIGTTQTDLTGIVNQPHGNNGDTSVSSTNTRPQPIQRANHLNGQGRPKSLTELLGPSQGRLGRAVLAPTSPFEQRQALTGFQDGEPAPKRQKRALGKENTYTLPRPTVMSPPNKAAFPIKHAIPTPVNVRPLAEQTMYIQATVRPLGGNRRIIDISSDEELQSEPITSSMTPHKSVGRNNVQMVEHHQINEESNKKAKKAAIQKARSPVNFKERTASSRILGPPQQVSIVQNVISTSSNANFDTSLKPGMSSLKMRSQPARRKLMYKALLPASTTGQNEEPAPMALTRREDTGNEDLLLTDITTQFSNLQEPEGSFQEDELSQSLLAKRVQSASKALLTPPRHSPVPQVLQPSPLFVSQTGSQRSPTPTRNFTEDDFNILATQEVIGQSNVEPDGLTDDSETDVDQLVLQTEPESPCFPLPPSKSKLSAQKTPKLMPPPRPPPLLPSESPQPPITHHTPSHTKTRPFARSLSANDSPLQNDPRASPFHTTLNSIEESPILLRNQQFSPLNPLPPLHLQSPKQRSPSSRSKPKSPIQRSRSDTAAIIPTTVAPTLQPDTDSANEQGPWTKLEAFVLFDKWPACKAKGKPIFEQLAVGAGGNSESDEDEEDGFGCARSPVARKVPPVLIRSARSFMRDGY